MLDSPFANGFGVAMKLRAIEMMQTENPSLWKIGQALGYKHDVILDHLKRDAVFRQKTEEAKKWFANRLEGVMAENALSPKGTLDRIAYLRAYMPERYARQEVSNSVVEININMGTIDAVRSRQAIDAEVVQAPAQSVPNTTEIPLDKTA